MISTSNNFIGTYYFNSFHDCLCALSFKLVLGTFWIECFGGWFDEEIASFKSF